MVDWVYSVGNKEHNSHNMSSTVINASFQFPVYIINDRVEMFPQKINILHHIRANSLDDIFEGIYYVVL